MRIGIGADHRGYKMKKHLFGFLIKKGFKVKDYGTNSEKPVDYPMIAIKLAQDVANKRLKYGILICYTGQGMAIAANKVSGIRAVICSDVRTAQLSRAHNNANIIVLPARLVNTVKSNSIINKFLNTDFKGGRHQRRIKEITLYENTACCK